MASRRRSGRCVEVVAVSRLGERAPDLRPEGEPPHFQGEWRDYTARLADAVVVLHECSMSKLAAIVTAQGWTQTEVATRRGVTQPRINDLLRDRLSRFSLDALVNIAAALGQRVHVELDVAGRVGRGRERAGARQPLPQRGEARGRKVKARTVARAGAERSRYHRRTVSGVASEARTFDCCSRSLASEGLLTISPTAAKGGLQGPRSLGLAPR